MTADQVSENGFGRFSDPNSAPTSKSRDSSLKSGTDLFIPDSNPERFITPIIENTESIEKDPVVIFDSNEQLRFTYTPNPDFVVGNAKNEGRIEIPFKARRFDCHQPMKPDVVYQLDFGFLDKYSPASFFSRPISWEATRFRPIPGGLSIRERLSLTSGKK